MHVARYRGDAGVSVGISVASASQIIGALPFSTFPDGVVLSTGTGLAPDLDVTLKDADVVSIDIEGVGTLSNVVRVGVASFGFLEEV